MQRLLAGQEMNSALIIIDMQMFMQERIDSWRDHVNPQYRCQNLPLNIEAALASNTRQSADAAGPCARPDRRAATSSITCATSQCT
jgi:hypothetical protein